MELADLDRVWGDPPTTLVGARAVLAGVVAGRCRLDAIEAVAMGVIARLEAANVAVSAAHEHAQVNRASASQGAKVARRATTATETMPSLGEGMADGDVSGGAVDVIANALASLSTQGERDAFVAFEPELCHAARTLSRSELARRVEMCLRRVRVDDGDRLRRQRRQARLCWFTDRLSGMWTIRGQFDPERGAIIQAQLESRREQLFHRETPEDAPADHLDRHEFLNAAAFTNLLTTMTERHDDDPSDRVGKMPTPRVDMSVVIDVDTLIHGPHEHTVCELDLDGFALPIDTIRRWACHADITPVIVADGGQRIMLGRTIELANRAQRRALAHLYRTCALCDTPYRHCEIHHVHWRSHGGTTNIDNLLPICVFHHHQVHDHHWQLHLAPDRTLTVTTPDGTQHTHPPPTATSPNTRTRARARPPNHAT